MASHDVSMEEVWGNDLGEMDVWGDNLGEMDVWGDNLGEMDVWGNEMHLFGDDPGCTQGPASPSLFLSLALAGDGSGHGPVRNKTANRRLSFRGLPWSWEEEELWEGEEEFGRTYGMTLKTAKHLVQVLSLEPSHVSQVKANNSSGSYADGITRLFTLILYLRGQTDQQIAARFRIRRATVRKYKNEVMHAIDQRLKKADFPHNNPRRLRALARGFERLSHGALRHCVGAIDCIDLDLSGRPLNVENAQSYFSRKYRYAIKMFAIADADRRIIYYNTRCVSERATSP